MIQKRTRTRKVGKVGVCRDGECYRRLLRICLEICRVILPLVLIAADEVKFPY